MTIAKKFEERFVKMRYTKHANGTEGMPHLSMPDGELAFRADVADWLTTAEAEIREDEKAKYLTTSKGQAWKRGYERGLSEGRAEWDKEFMDWVMENGEGMIVPGDVDHQCLSSIRVADILAFLTSNKEKR